MGPRKSVSKRDAIDIAAKAPETESTTPCVVASRRSRDNRWADVATESASGQCDSGDPGGSTNTDSESEDHIISDEGKVADDVSSLQLSLSPIAIVAQPQRTVDDGSATACATAARAVNLPFFENGYLLLSVPELLVEIFLYLDSPTICTAVALACCDFFDICESDFFWKCLCCRDASLPIPQTRTKSVTELVQDSDVRVVRPQRGLVTLGMVRACFEGAGGVDDEIEEVFLGEIEKIRMAWKRRAKMRRLVGEDVNVEECSSWKKTYFAVMRVLRDKGGFRFDRRVTCGVVGRQGCGKTELIEKFVGGKMRNVKEVSAILGIGRVRLELLENRHSRPVIVVCSIDDSGLVDYAREFLPVSSRCSTVFAVNKVDLAGDELFRRNLERFREFAMREEDMAFVEVSAKTGEGLDELIELIVHRAQMTRVN